MDALPQHIGYIIDGNRRWAKKHGLPTYEGHLAGYNAIKDILLETLRQGVKYASAYVFSTENWKRSEEEVGRLMGLFLRALESDVSIFIEHNVRLRVIGDHVRSGLMLMTDGVAPGNEARGYVLRRLLRRSIRSMRLLGYQGPSLVELLSRDLDAE